MKMNNGHIVIVSGLPRSGTSMMMQMLEAGGMPVIRDEIRKPDEDNPIGYYEYDRVKRLRDDASWINGCVGMAIKVISALLFHLPSDNQYKVIFMQRRLEEIVASQKAMLGRTGRKMVFEDDRSAIGQFQEHLLRIEEWLRGHKNIDTMYICYNEAIKNPFEMARCITEFVGLGLNADRMANAIKEDLYRQKGFAS